MIDAKELKDFEWRGDIKEQHGLSPTSGLIGESDCFDNYHDRTSGIIQGFTPNLGNTFTLFLGRLAQQRSMRQSGLIMDW